MTRVWFLVDWRSTMPTFPCEICFITRELRNRNPMSTYSAEITNIGITKNTNDEISKAWSITEDCTVHSTPCLVVSTPNCIACNKKIYRWDNASSNTTKSAWRRRTELQVFHPRVHAQFEDKRIFDQQHQKISVVRECKCPKSYLKFKNQTTFFGGQQWASPENEDYCSLFRLC